MRALTRLITAGVGSAARRTGQANLRRKPTTAAASSHASVVEVYGVDGVSMASVQPHEDGRLAVDPVTGISEWPVDALNAGRASAA